MEIGESCKIFLRVHRLPFVHVLKYICFPYYYRQGNHIFVLGIRIAGIASPTVRLVEGVRTARRDDQEKKRGRVPALLLFCGQRMWSRVTCPRSPRDGAASPAGESVPSGQSSISPVSRLRKAPPVGTLSYARVAYVSVVRPERVCGSVVAKVVPSASSCLGVRARSHRPKRDWAQGSHLHLPFAAPE